MGLLPIPEPEGRLACACTGPSCFTDLGRAREAVGRPAARELLRGGRRPHWAVANLPCSPMHAGHSPDPLVWHLRPAVAHLPQPPSQTILETVDSRHSAPALTPGDSLP